MTAQPHPDKLNHPIMAETEVINERELMVFDNIRRMPNYNEQFVTPYMTISLNLQGWVKAECDMRNMLGSMMETLLLMLQEYRLQNGIEEHRPTASEELFTRFHENIVKHYHESHKVRFYAELQNLSPKYFALTIRKQTGIRAHEWINNYVTMQAKRLLLHERKTSIQQIAQQLGFPDQAVFSRFFKKNAGMSPSEYRALF